MTKINFKNDKTKTTKQITNTLLTSIAMFAIFSLVLVFQTPFAAVAQPAISNPNACNEGIVQDIQTKSASFDEIKAKNVADNFGQLKTAVGNDNYKFTSVSYTWKNDASACTVQLKDILVQYMATDVDGKERAIIIVLDPNYTGKSVFVEENFPHHNLSNAANWGGYSVKGNSTESTSKVYRATLNWLIPTPNDPSQLDCGTLNEQQCIISVWTGLSQAEGGTSNLAQLASKLL